MANWSDPAFGYNTFYGSINDLSKTHSAYDPVVEVADESKTAIAGSWTGEGSLALLATLQDFRNTIPAIQEVVESARAALVSYKESLATIHWASLDWIAQVDTAQYALNQSDRPVWDVIGHAEDTAARAVNVYRLAEARGQLEILYRRRRDADHEVINALAAAMPASWAKQSAGFASAGVTQAVLLSAADSKKAMLDLVERMVAGDLSDENIAALDGLLSVWGNSQTTMSSFFTALGGAKAVELIDRLGEQIDFASGAYGTELSDSDQAIMSLAYQIRSGLAVGAADWDSEVTDAYINDMMTGSADYFNARADTAGMAYFSDSGSARIQAMAFFFADSLNTPMPENLTLSAAEFVDQLERVEGGSSLINVVPAESGFGASVFSMFVDGEYVGGTSQNDLSGRILETLGLYPDSAMNFVSEEGRIEYWFQDRIWSGLDGFAGPGGLWLGVANADGKASADAVSDIMFALSRNGSFNSDNITDAGSARLASALSVDLATITEFALMGPEDYKGNSGSELVTMFGAGSDTWAPTVTSNVLSVIIGGAGSQDLGAFILNQASIEIQQGYIEYGMMTSPENFQEALRQSNTLQGFIDGSSIGETLAAAERSDTRREELIEGLSSLAGIIPVPSVGEILVHGGSFALDLAQNALLELGNEALTGLALGGPVDYNAALIATGVTEDTLRDSRMYANGVAVWNYLQTEAAHDLLAEEGIDPTAIPQPEPRADGESQADFIKRSNDWYFDNVDELNTSAQTAFEDDNFLLQKVLGAYGAHEGDGESEGTK